MTFNCDQCDASYSVEKSLGNHKRFKHGDAKQFACQQCVYTTSKKENLGQHVRSQHEKVKEICKVCRKEYSDKPTLNRHVRNFHPVIVQKDKESVVTENVKNRGIQDIHRCKSSSIT